MASNSRDTQLKNTALFFNFTKTAIVIYEITSMVRVEAKFIGSDRPIYCHRKNRYRIGISVKLHIGATLIITGICKREE